MVLPIQVAIESGRTRTFASALDWPGWVRSGRDEDGALNTLLAYGPRYKKVIHSAAPGYRVPTTVTDFRVMDRVAGNAATDFGVPEKPVAAEADPVDTATLDTYIAILSACWDAFARAAEQVTGHPLKKGPRGGGRELDQIVQHVIESHYGYLRRILSRDTYSPLEDLSAAVRAVKEAGARALVFACSQEMPETGPRGGRLWKPRYFMRRAAWHILDHAWEIEDRREATVRSQGG